MRESVARSIADALISEWKESGLDVRAPLERDPDRPCAVPVAAELNRPARDELRYLRRVYGDDTLRIVRRHQRANVVRVRERAAGVGHAAERPSSLEAA